MPEESGTDLIKLEKPAFTSKRLQYTYQLLFVLSIMLNIISSVFAYIQHSRLVQLDIEKKTIESHLSQLDIEKKTIENRVLVTEHLPEFSTFRLIYEINTLSKFLQSGDQPPFLNKNKSFRILENGVYELVKGDLEAIRKHNRVSSRTTFLVVANTHDSTAYAVTIGTVARQQYKLGDLEGHSTVMIPLAYENAAKSIKVGSDDLVKIDYEVRIFEKAEPRQIPIPLPANVTWTPVINDSSGIGRALQGQGDEERLNELLPPQ
jgi:hypothetical protein